MCTVKTASLFVQAFDGQSIDVRCARVPKYARYQCGFTLVELIMVIVVMGVIGGAVAVFMKGPIDAYFDTTRRAGISDMADTAVRRMARDIRKALPNSIRVSSDGQCIEFIPTRTGGRYRLAGPGNFIAPNTPITNFNMLADHNASNSAIPVDQRIQIGDLIAIYNMAGQTELDVRLSAVTAEVVAPAPVRTGTAPNYETVISIASTTFPYVQVNAENPRFQVIPGDEKIVSYICSGGSLYRNTNYAYATSCPVPALTVPVIANAATCNFVQTLGVNGNALVQLALTFSSASEAASIYHEVHVSVSP